MDGRTEGQMDAITISPWLFFKKSLAIMICIVVKSVMNC